MFSKDTSVTSLSAEGELLRNPSFVISSYNTDTGIMVFQEAPKNTTLRVATAISGILILLAISFVYIRNISPSSYIWVHAHLSSVLSTTSRVSNFSSPSTYAEYVALARQDATSAGISPDYFVKQINQESGFNPRARSIAGAEGIAQFEPATAAGLGVDPWNPVSALSGAARLMASYNRTYGGNYAMALAAYNGGPGVVDNAIASCGSTAWMNCLSTESPETRSYIHIIMGI